jgi:D-3-phosphoglycerate dehydrogenase
MTTAERSTGRVKIALVDLDGKPVPDWVPLTIEHAGIDLAIQDCTTREQLAEHAVDADVVWLFGGKRILIGNLDAIPRCRAILRTGSGIDNVPVEEARRRGISVTNTPTVFSDAVSDHVIALLFCVVRRVSEMDRAIRKGRWDQNLAEPFQRFRGRTLGLVGFGHIPRELTRKLSGFEMKVLASDPFVSANVMASFGVTPVDLNALLRESDFVSLHCPLTDQTRGLIGRQQLRSMKSTAVLINTSRGPVVDERALVEALTERWIAGAGLDVLEHEPPAPGAPILQLENVVLTPHSASLSAEGIDLRWRVSVETVTALAKSTRTPSPISLTTRP